MTASAIVLFGRLSDPFPEAPDAIARRVAVYEFLSIERPLAVALPVLLAPRPAVFGLPLDAL